MLKGPTRAGGSLVFLALMWTSTSLGRSGAEPDAPRHLIYVHGAIVQNQQQRRPRHPRFGYYELDQILDAFRREGFVVAGEVRPKEASVDESANALVEKVRGLLRSGVGADHVTVLGASMGAEIALRAAARLQEDRLRFAVLGVCASERVRAIKEEEKAPRGQVLAFREASDEISSPCAGWSDGAGSTLRLREVVLHTGLAHGFLYRPLPEWVTPTIEWARTSVAP
jgi:pimeloyl-ACP methyl ester carboxylesterase